MTRLAVAVRGITAVLWIHAWTVPLELWLCAGPCQWVVTCWCLLAEVHAGRQSVTALPQIGGGCTSEEWHLWHSSLPLLEGPCTHWWHL